MLKKYLKVSIKSGIGQSYEKIKKIVNAEIHIRFLA